MHLYGNPKFARMEYPRTPKETHMYRVERVRCGVIAERFFRRAESPAEIREMLRMFRWGCGRWRIQRTD